MGRRLERGAAWPRAACRRSTSPSSGAPAALTSRCRLLASPGLRPIQEPHCHGQGAQGAAAKAGLARGDVAMAINGQPLASVDGLRRVLAARPKRVALLVWRDGEQLFVPVPLV